LGLEKTKEQVEIYNIGSEDQVDVKTIAHAVTEEMKLKNTKFTFTGGVDGGRGWKGDVKIMLLSIAKLKRLGWRPSLGSEQSVKRVVHELLKSKSAQDQHETNRQ
jgi:UDP-glucose 4-epimerase